MRFPTTATRGQQRPLVALHAIAPNGRRIVVDALVDSGADLTLFTPAAAELLELDLTHIPETPISSAFGTVDSYQAVPLQLELRRPPDSLAWSANVGFVKRHLTYCILGTRGFFEFFRFHYDVAHSQFELFASASPL